MSDFERIKWVMEILMIIFNQEGSNDNGRND